MVISYGKTWVNFCWIDDTNRSPNRTGFSNLKTFHTQTRIQKFRNMSGVGV